MSFSELKNLYRDFHVLDTISNLIYIIEKFSG